MRFLSFFFYFFLLNQTWHSTIAHPLTLSSDSPSNTMYKSDSKGQIRVHKNSDLSEEEVRKILEIKKNSKDFSIDKLQEFLERSNTVKEEEAKGTLEVVVLGNSLDKWVFCCEFYCSFNIKNIIRQGEFCPNDLECMNFIHNTEPARSRLDHDTFNIFPFPQLVIHNQMFLITLVCPTCCCDYVWYMLLNSSIVVIWSRCWYIIQVVWNEISPRADIYFNLKFDQMII